MFIKPTVFVVVTVAQMDRNSYMMNDKSKSKTHSNSQSNNTKPNACFYYVKCDSTEEFEIQESVCMWDDYENWGHRTHWGPVWLRDELWMCLRWVRDAHYRMEAFRKNSLDSKSTEIYYPWFMVLWRNDSILNVKITPTFIIWSYHS